MQEQPYLCFLTRQTMPADNQQKQQLGYRGKDLLVVGLLLVAMVCTGKTHWHAAHAYA